MRNGIAHSGVRYSANEIRYVDVKGNELSLSPSAVVRKFDDFLDVCNGLVFAFSVFSKSRSYSDSSVSETSSLKICVQRQGRLIGMSLERFLRKYLRIKSS